MLLLLSSVVSAQSISSVDKAATSTISGKVTVGGKGLGGVVVGLINNNQPNVRLRQTRFRSTTDEDGNYRITNVPPGNYIVAAASPVYVPTEWRKSLIIGKNETVENIDIALERGGVITGKVTDADGRPLVEELVRISAATSMPQSSFVRDVLTDDRGIYRAYGIRAGSYKVSVGREMNYPFGSRRPGGVYQRTYHPGALDPAGANVVHVIEGSEATGVDITVGGPAYTYSARGRIIDGDTARPVPLTRVGLQIFWDRGASSSGSVTESTKAGEFKIENLAPGKYAVYSELPSDSGSYSEIVQFEVTDRDVEGLLIKISKGASVLGVVMLEGSDDPRVRAALFGNQVNGYMVGRPLGPLNPSATINPDGSFRVNGLPGGRLVLYVQPRERFRLIRLERDGLFYPGGLEIKESEQVTGVRVVVGHANAAIRGVIQLPTGVELPAMARILVTVRRTVDHVSSPYISQVTADARGHFRTESLVPGTYEIAVSIMSTSPAQHPKILPAKQTVVVTNGAVADVTIALQPAPGDRK